MVLTHRRLAEGVAVIFALAFHGWLALSSAAEKSAAFDEIAHLGGGYLQWTAADYRWNAESGTLPQRWAALPLLAEAPEIPAADHPERQRANVWFIGRHLLYGEDGPALHRLSAARAMIVLLGIALGGTVYCISRALWGVPGAAVSLALYSLSPTMLAHARLVTADQAAALFFLLATWALWRLLHRVSPGRLAAAAAATAGLLLSKMSGLLIAPVGGLLALVRLVRSAPLETALGTRSWHTSSLRQRAAAVATALLLTGLAVLFILWAAYGFRYAAEPTASPGGSSFLHSWDSLVERGGAATALVSVAQRLRLLPESYLWGLAYTLDTTGERDAFLAGRTRKTGWWGFFPYAVAVKTPPALLGLLVLAGMGWVRARAEDPRQPRMEIRGDPTSHLRDGPPGRLYATLPLWVLLVVYWLAAVTSGLNIGHRHMLPTYPVIFILAGAAGLWISRRSLLATALVTVSLLAFAFESWAVRPHYLSYFSPLAGGPVNGYRHLVDSSLDWGQDLPALKAWVDRFRAEEGDEIPLYLAYFGSVPPRAHGIDAHPLYSFCPLADPSRPPAPLRGGVYCVSATLLQSLHMELLGPWTPERENALHAAGLQVRHFVELLGTDSGREKLAGERPPGEWMAIFRAYDRLRCGRLFRYLRRREPDDQAAHSINIYRLSDGEVSEALIGPSPEAEGQETEPPGSDALPGGSP